MFVKAEFEALATIIKAYLGTRVDEVLIEKQIDNSQPFHLANRVLTINADHPTIASLAKNAANMKNQIMILYEASVLASGSLPEDPKGFASSINKLVGLAMNKVDASELEISELPGDLSVLGASKS